MSLIKKLPVENADELEANAYRIDLPDFYGPMDLLLGLIEQEDLEITQISLAKVTDQFLAYVRNAQSISPDSLTDFLVVAAKLILIKSQVLLPKPPPGILDEDEEDSADDLVQQLRDYKRFKTLASDLKTIQEQGGRSYIRIAPPPKLEAKLDIGDVSIDDLLAAVRHALSVKPEAAPVSTVVSRQKYTIGNQIKTIRQRLKSSKRIRFYDLLENSRTRVEVIVTLLAVLELVKRQVVDIAQDESFGEIEISQKDEATKLSEDDWEDLEEIEDVS